jgi:membrane-associated phospholipid phosphatase
VCGDGSSLVVVCKPAPIYIACVAAVAIGVIGANYHFLSDVIGGIFVGITAGYLTRKMAHSKMAP